MATLKNNRTIKSGGKLWRAYFEQAKAGQLDFEVIEKKAAFGLGYGSEKTVQTFECDGKKYAVKGYDHFNAHFSGFTDESAIYGIHIAEIV